MSHEKQVYLLLCIHLYWSSFNSELRIRSDPDLFGRIRKIFAGSGSCRYFGKVKLYKQRKNILNRGFTHFKENFSIFSDKNNHHSNSRRNMFDVKKIQMFELILGKYQQDPDPVFKFMICWIRIRPKTDRIRNPAGRLFYQQFLCAYSPTFNPQFSY